MNNLHPVFIRENVISDTRTFFQNKHFHEVISPSLNTALPLEPNLYAFATTWQTASETKQLFLSTSPESAIKKMLARGIGNCFAIGSSFRNLEGAGSLHTPEFLMLEWYREDADYKDIMKDVKELILFLNKDKSPNLTYQGETISLTDEWPIFSMVELFKKYADLNLEEILEDTVLFQKAKDKGYSIKNTTWGALFDQILVNEIELQLPKTPFFIVDFPARISPLCTPQKKRPYLVERFEVYLFGMELGNGNTEYTNVESVRNSFIKEKQMRELKGELAPPIDEEFLAALHKMSTKTYGGIGLGIDRLAMILADVTQIIDLL